MPNNVVYEWDYEVLDELNEEVVDHNERDTLADFSTEDITNSLVLVRNEGNENAGLQERTWAYVVDDKLPEYFSDALGNPITKVPKRFHDEFNKYLASLCKI